MATNVTDTITTIQQWHGIMRELREAEEAGTLISAENADTPASDAIVERIVAARAAMLSTPAPNCPALLDKLGIIFAKDREGDESTNSWGRDIVAQTLADMERLLGQNAHRDRLATVTRYAERMAGQLAVDLLDITEAATFADGDASEVVKLAGDALTNQAILAEQLRELADLIEAA